MELSVNKRLIEYCSVKKINQKEVAQNLGLKSQQVNKWFTLSEQVPDRHIVRFLRIYTDVNANWLIYDEGEMLKASMFNMLQFGATNKNAQVNSLKERIIELKKDKENLELLNKLVLKENEKEKKELKQQKEASSLIPKE